jgi:hypothetical protein
MTCSNIHGKIHNDQRSDMPGMCVCVSICCREPKKERQNEDDDHDKDINDDDNEVNDNDIIIMLINLFKCQAVWLVSYVLVRQATCPC